MTVRHPYFRRKLAVPITPKVGLGTALRTLDDCPRFLGSLHGWRQARPHWEFAAELILALGPDGARTLTPLRSESNARSNATDGSDPLTFWPRPNMNMGARRPRG